jgi:hypothetical protein
VKRIFNSLAISAVLLAPGVTLGAYHQIISGDTLTQIAETNYGNWVKWRDLWAINKKNIPNPDLIYPGQRLRLLNDEELAHFMKSSVKLPKTVEDDTNEESATLPKGNRRSQEWRLLPTQSWEKYIFKTDPSIDPDGFDRRSKVMKRIADKTTATMTISSDRIPILGEITRARSEYERLFLGDQIFIRADENLQVGSTYSVTTGPQKIVSKRDSRVGFGYDLTGRVRIIGVRDGLFIATITALYYPIRRGQLLIPEVPDYNFPEAIPAPAAISASVVVPEGARADMLGEQKILYLDAGSQDGIKPGMIFRHYLHTDPYTGASISAKDFLIEDELQVLSVKDKFSVAIILRSHTSMHFGDDVIALTDLQDFEKNQGLQTLLQDSNKPTTVDDLDQMDANDGLGEKENQDLKQLEKWTRPTSDMNSPPASGLVPDDEIMKVNPAAHPRQIYEIGKEPAPNDGSNTKPVTAPSNPTSNTNSDPVIVPAATPEPTPMPAPIESSTPTAVPLLDTPTTDATPATTEAPLAPLNSSQPAPIPDATPITTSTPITSDPELDSTPGSMSPTAPANGTPSGNDPFASPSPSPFISAPSPTPFM